MNNTFFIVFCFNEFLIVLLTKSIFISFTLQRCADCKDVRIILILQEGTCPSVTYLEVTIVEYLQLESKKFFKKSFLQ